MLFASVNRVRVYAPVFKRGEKKSRRNETCFSGHVANTCVLARPRHMLHAGRQPNTSITTRKEMRFAVGLLEQFMRLRV